MQPIERSLGDWKLKAHKHKPKLNPGSTRNRLSRIHHNILHVMKVLGHKNIPLFYTQLISFESDEYHSATATTVQNAQKLVEAGFEYVCDFNEVKVFRKRK